MSAIVEAMFLNFGKTKQERWARVAGMALCFLVLVFSFAAKLSLYQPKMMQIKALASSKMWQHEVQDAAAVMAAPRESALSAALSDLQNDLLVTVVIVILASLAASELLEREPQAPAQSREFVSGSRLRAPPVR